MSFHEALGNASCLSRRLDSIHGQSCSKALACRQHKPRERTRRAVTVASSGPNFLQKLGRVLKEKATGDIDRILKGASKTRERLGVAEELFTYWNLNSSDDTLEELEEALISADFGPRTALKIVDQLRQPILAGKLKTGADIRSAMKESIISLLESRGGSSELNLGVSKPAVILVIGVNGGGKTTTIGKLAHKFVGEGVTVLLAAGDTFRAAAAEQLEAWAERSGAGFFGPSRERHRPDALMYDAIQKAQNESMDIVICDSSGRLHTNIRLMEELAKCRRSIYKRHPGAPHETLLVLDGTTGLNMLNQTREFNETVPITGLVLTKLDGTARGGAVISVVDELGIPIKFLGVGETVNDLQPFDARTFVDALFPAAKEASLV